MIRKQIKLKRLKFHINEFTKNNVYKHKKINYCSICGGKKFIKYGYYNGIQRYKCKECGKSFSKTTNSLLSYSKKDLNIWIEFIELMMKRKSLRFCAEKLNINLATAFYWRHKILHVLKSDSIPKTLKGYVHINKTILKENFKGNRNIGSKRRRNIWVVAAKGNEDSMLVIPAFTDFWDWNLFKNKIYSKIEEEAYIVPYEDRYIRIQAKKHNQALETKVNTSPENRIKYIIVNLRKWIGKYKGVATKYLESYLQLFVLFNLDRKIDYIDVTSYLWRKNSFIKTQEIKMQQLKI
ncbi:IS1 family transposase [Clostridium sp. C2-6-12]|uniref:IS1 family transposase n=1 Tax=Clostridium sp. C2-6-12 TaxID=2698832 RepID=UPI00136F63B7|nr:IS1 family transposase [Clostridium sp. C2-6-12]